MSIILGYHKGTERGGGVILGNIPGQFGNNEMK